MFAEISDATPWSKEPDPDKRKVLKKVFLGDTVEFYLSRFEKELKINNGHFGGKVRGIRFFHVFFCVFVSFVLLCVLVRLCGYKK